MSTKQASQPQNFSDIYIVRTPSTPTTPAPVETPAKSTTLAAPGSNEDTQKSHIGTFMSKIKDFGGSTDDFAIDLLGSPRHPSPAAEIRPSKIRLEIIRTASEVFEYVEKTPDKGLLSVLV